LIQRAAEMHAQKEKKKIGWWMDQRMNVFAGFDYLPVLVNHIGWTRADGPKKSPCRRTC
jgi:hypothetical protein